MASQVGGPDDERIHRVARASPRRRYLVADDDESCRTLLELALSTPDSEVLVATDGGELLTLIAEEGPFDAVVTDINMPWMQGLQVLATVREAGLTTPVLVVTGMTSAELPAAVARLGHARLLLKPFTVQALRAELAALQRPAAGDGAR
jgi:DNA-binding response OmpR family regulator